MKRIKGPLTEDEKLRYQVGGGEYTKSAREERRRIDWLLTAGKKAQFEDTTYVKNTVKSIYRDRKESNRP